MYLLTPFYRQLAIGLLAISLSAITGISQAALLYEQAPVDPIDGPLVDINSGTGLFADNFTIGHATLDSITWWGAYLAQDTDNFVIKLYSDLGGTGTLQHDFGSVTPVAQTPFTDSANNPYYRYQFDLSAPLELSAGTYFLSIENQGLSTWAWLYGNLGNGSFWNLPDGVPNWSLAKDDQGLVIAHDLAFRLDGNPIQNVPEPAALLMLLAGSLLSRSRKLGRC